MADNKQNKNPNVPNSGNAPKLRFPEFTEDWVQYKCSELLEFYSTNSLSWEQLDYDNNDLLNLHYGLIHVGLPTLVNVEQHNLPSVKPEFKPKNYTLCKSGDIAFADASEDTNEVAKPIEFYDCSDKQVVCGLHTIHGRDKLNATEIGFKGYAFSSMPFHHKIRRLAQGSKIYSISSKNFSEVTIGIPTKEEQRKIVDLLSKIDERITTQNKIIEDLKKLKVAISQVCFEQKPIDEIPLHKFFKKGKAGGTPTSTNKEYYDGEIPFLSINDITEQGKYIYSTEKHLSEKGLLNSSAWVVPVNSLILSMYASVGLTTINKIPLATSQAMFSMELKEPELIDYLYYYLTYFKYRYIHRYLETGTQSNINADIVKSIKIPNYGKSKNIEMSAMLANIDKKIEIENKYLQSLLSQKAYLFSNMFI